MTWQAYSDDVPSSKLGGVAVSIKVSNEVYFNTFSLINSALHYGNKHIVEFIDKTSTFAFLFEILTLNVILSKYIFVTIF